MEIYIPASSVSLTAARNNDKIRKRNFLPPAINVQFPEGLVQIGPYAFSQSPLGNVSFSNAITIIDGGAFEACCLTQVLRPERLECLGAFAFFGNPIAAEEIILLPETLTLPAKSQGASYVSIDSFFIGDRMV